MESIKTLLKSERPIKWVFAGDSITHGAVHTFGARDYVQSFEERVRCEMQRLFDVIIRTAIAGWTTRDLKQHLDWAVLRFKPDVVSIMIGMNDCCFLPLSEFLDNYSLILEEIASKTSAKIVLHSPNPIIPGTDPSREPHLASFAEGTIKLAAERNLPLVDHWNHWHKAWKEDPLRTYAWMSDPIHPGDYGHRAFCRLLLQELGIWDETSRTGRLMIP